MKDRHKNKKTRTGAGLEEVCLHNVRMIPFMGKLISITLCHWVHGQFDQPFSGHGRCSRTSRSSVNSTRLVPATDVRCRCPSRPQVSCAAQALTTRPGRTSSLLCYNPTQCSTCVSEGERGGAWWSAGGTALMAASRLSPSGHESR